MLEEIVGTRTNKRQIYNFWVVIPTFLEIPKFNFDEHSFPRAFSMSRTRICYPFALAITFEGRKAFDILDQKWFMSSKIKNSQCGEVRSKKFFQILKKFIKTRPVMYFSSQTDNMSMRTTRITNLFNIQEGS